MSYYRHHAILVTAHDGPSATVAFAAAHAKAIELGCTVSEIIASPWNAYRSFFVAPDGSSEGRDASDEGDARRAALVAFLESQRHEDQSSMIAWVEVQYGDDDWETRIVSDSDAVRRARSSDHD